MTALPQIFEEGAMTDATALRLFLLVITNAGGEGKTWITMLLLTIFRLLDQDILTLDGDPGNRASSAADIGAKAMDVFEDPQKLTDRISNSLAGTKSLLVDAGANILAASVSFGDTMRDVGFKLEDDGYRVKGLWVVSTNKIGAAESATAAARRFGQPFEPLWLFNDRDGSGMVPAGLEPDITVAHLAPGYVVLVNEAGGFEPIVREGIPGYQMSADIIAKYVWRFADQHGVRALFGDVAIDSLRSILDRDVMDLHPVQFTSKKSDDEIIEWSAHLEILRIVTAYRGDIDAMIRALTNIKSRGC
ncbi:hypothetical protein GRI40_13235 [Altererythrobacter aerius]|uniref:CobQ/CobB/MinD/ParA nucleotide binding domain-containing protein n=1 Tax=Tsuneonella aeria TaxID=1837929 RepID=A0A6I4THM4_9SPHN|nr:hypothetical protein [Tsuneonella aeria]MXO76176.1 hypothetical protein [Tsuneonella aeria]